MDFSFAWKVENCDREISSFESEKKRRMRWARHFALMGVRRGVCKVLVVKPMG